MLSITLNITAMTSNEIIAKKKVKDENIKAMRKYVYFTFNWAPDFISRIWGKGTALTEHFVKKLESYDYNINRFFVELSLDNQRKMLSWILENYKG